MRGVVLAGGLGTRLYPLTHVTNKHLLPVYDKPMIYRPIETLVKAGIDEIAIVVGGPHAGSFISILKNGEDFGLKHIEYVYQNEEGGIAHALSLVEKFANGGDITVILGDNCTDVDISDNISEFKGGAMVFLKQVDDPNRFGVAEFDEDDENKIVAIHEKPSNPPSRFAVTGLYVYDSTAFDRIRSLSPSTRGELEITDLNNSYLKDGKLNWALLDAFWSDAGTFDSLYEVNSYWKNKERG